MAMPQGVCVKAKSLRPMYANLEEWLENGENELVTRGGRIFIGSGDDKRVFHYPGSDWANPFSVRDYGLEECLKKYREHLDRILADDNTRRKFLDLKSKKRLGCFCKDGAPCHRDIILARLSEISDA